MTIARLISALHHDPVAVHMRYTLTYYQRVKSAENGGASSDFIRFGPDELPDFVRSVTLPDGMHVMGDLMCRLARNRSEAVREAACNSTVYHAIGSPALVRRLTNLPDMAKGLRVEHPIQSRDVAFYRRFDGDLSSLLQRHVRLSTVQAMRLLYSCCMLLARMHAHGLVHGGVQPSSVLYSSGGYGGLHFCLSDYANVRSVRDGNSATVESSELYDRIDPLDMDILRDYGRGDIAAGPRGTGRPALLYSSAQLDLVPLALLLARMVQGGYLTGDDPRMALLIHSIQSACLRSDADFSTLKDDVLPQIERVLNSPSYYRDSSKWEDEGGDQDEGANQDANADQVASFIRAVRRIQAREYGRRQRGDRRRASKAQPPDRDQPAAWLQGMWSASTTVRANVVRQDEPV